MKTIIAAAVLLAASATAVFGQDRPSIVVAADGVEWLPFEEALATAKAEEKKVLVDVYAPWCSFCRRMHVETYSNAEVQSYLADNFVATRVNADDPEDTYQYREHELSGPELGYHFNARGFPTTAFLLSSGDFLTPLPGYVEASDFLSVLRYIATDSYESTSFEDFRSEQSR